MDYDIIDTSAAAWVEAVATAKHDFYHLPAYQQLAAGFEERPRAFLAREGQHSFLLPFLCRSIPVEIGGADGLFDVSSAYGYPGPIWSCGAPDTFIAAAVQQFASWLAHAGGVSAFIRLHTILNEPAHFTGVGEIVSHGPSVYIDLTHTDDELWAQTRRGHKRDLRVLTERGYEVVMDDWSRLDDFITCYYDSMRRLGASDFYFFPKSYFEQLKGCVGEARIHLCLVYLDGDIACAGLVTEIEGLCQYHLSATADAHFADHPSKLMLNHLRTWLKRRGNQIFHVGGGFGGSEDKLYLFKAGFSPYSVKFNTWRLIPDQSLYDRLVVARGHVEGLTNSDGPSFFPLYRA